MLLLLRLKLRPVVEIRELLSANMHDHVNLAVAVDILKVGGGRDLRRVGANNGGTVIDAGMSNIAAGKLNYYHAAFQVEKNKVGRMSGAVVVAYYRIDLVGSRKPIGGV